MAMTLDQLTDHIKQTVGPILQAEFGKTLKDAVSAKVEEALKPVQDGMTQRQADIQAFMKAAVAAANGTSTISEKKRTNGEAFGLCILALRFAKNDIGGAAKYLKQRGHNDLSDLMASQAQEVTEKAMTAGDPETGGILIPAPVSAEIIDILRNRVVVRSLGPTQIPLPSGNYRMPKKTQGTSASYVGESQAAETSRVKHGSELLSFKKLVTVVPMSNDLVRYSSPEAGGLVRDDIVDNMAVREDQAFLRDSGGLTPKGLKKWADDAANNMACTTSFDLTKVTTDLGRIWLKLVEAKVPMVKPAWIMAPRTYNYLRLVRTTNGPFAFGDEMARGTLLGIPFVWTTQVPTNLTVGALTSRSELYLCDFNDVLIGDSMSLAVDASGEAAYEEGGSVKSAFHRDETVIRAIAEHDMIMRRTESVAYFQDINWA